MANTTLAGDTTGVKVTETVSTAADGTRESVSKAYDSSGALTWSINKSVSADGGTTHISFDDNAQRKSAGAHGARAKLRQNQTPDGVVDRLTTIAVTHNSDGTTTETELRKSGSDALSAVTTFKQETVTSADGNTVTISRASTGGTWFDTRETRTTNAGQSINVTTQDLAQDGHVITSSTVTVSNSGQTRTTAQDLDGDTNADVTTVYEIGTADGERTETTTVKNGDGFVRSKRGTALKQRRSMRTKRNAPRCAPECVQTPPRRLTRLKLHASLGLSLRVAGWLTCCRKAQVCQG
ncbi:MAG: hypothetical protein U1E15_09575 [Hyphomicrobiales bacterium]